MKVFLTALLLLLLFNKANSQSTPQEITNKFFATYKLGDTDKAIDFLFSYSPYAKDIAEGINEVKQKLKGSAPLLGRFHGADLFATKTIGQNLVMLSYLVRHQREPLVFNIMFYKPADKWQMQNFKYGSSLDDELEEASKAFRLKENQ